jgi:hypothetical protein
MADELEIGLSPEQSYLVQCGVAGQALETLGPPRKHLEDLEDGFTKAADAQRSIESTKRLARSLTEAVELLERLPLSDEESRADGGRLMAVCMQCGEAEAIYANRDGSNVICQDCSDLNLTAHLLGAERRGEATLRKDDTKAPPPVPFYVGPPGGEPTPPSQRTSSTDLDPIRLEIDPEGEAS